MYSAEYALRMAEEILLGLGGVPTSLTLLTGYLQVLEPEVDAVTAVEAISENIFPTSHSAVLRMSLPGDGLSRSMFLKKVTASAMRHKPWADRRAAADGM